jgi:hypothetical protein
MIPNYREGDLVRIIRSGTFTLCQLLGGDIPAIRECPVKVQETKTHPQAHRYHDTYKNLEGKVGLVVHVVRNRLEQPLGYRVLIEGHEMICKSKVAQKYFELAENQGHEGRRFSKV